MSFFASYPSGGGVLSINGLTGAVTLVAGTNITLVPAGNSITINSTAGGGGANDTLSNLSAPTSINQDLLSDADGTRSLGESGNAWAALFSPFISSDGADLILLSQTNNIFLRANSGGEVGVRNTSGTIALPIRFYDDDNSNYIGLKAPATVSVDLDYVLPDVDGASGDVLSTDGAGVMSWTTPAAAGANTALSNLTTTAVNQDLIHGTPNTDWVVQTADNGAGDSGDLLLRVGAATGTRGEIGLDAPVVSVGDSGTVIMQPYATGAGNLGQVARIWGAAYISEIYGMNGATPHIHLSGTPNTTPSGASVRGYLQGLDSFDMGIFTQDLAGNTNSLWIETGGSSSFASGLLHLQSGPANTTSGAVSITSGNAATGASGNINIASGTAGTTRGTVSLSGSQVNFTGNLVPSANITYALGTTALRMADVITERVQVRDGIDRLQLILNGIAPSVGAGTFNSLASGVGQNLAIYSRTNNSGASGPVYLESGKNDASSGSTNTGLLNIQTGDLTNAGNAGASGLITIKSGNVLGAGRSGPLSILSGNSVDDVSGDVLVASGVVTNASSTGQVRVTSGDGLQSGALHLTTGAASAGDSGSMFLTCGTATGTRGRIVMVADFLQLPRQSSEPATVTTSGAVFYDTSIDKIKVYNGSTWEVITSV